MTFGGTSLTNLAGAFGRTFGGSRTAHKVNDSEFDIYERAPELRADIEAMLTTEIAFDAEEAEQEEILRESEKREHDTMCMIRGALYPAE